MTVTRSSDRAGAHGACASAAAKTCRAMSRSSRRSRFFVKVFNVYTPSSKPKPTNQRISGLCSNCSTSMRSLRTVRSAWAETRARRAPNSNARHQSSARLAPHRRRRAAQIGVLAQVGVRGREDAHETKGEPSARGTDGCRA